MDIYTPKVPSVERVVSSAGAQKKINLYGGSRGKSTATYCILPERCQVKIVRFKTALMGLHVSQAHSLSHEDWNYFLNVRDMSGLII